MSHLRRLLSIVLASLFYTLALGTGLWAQSKPRNYHPHLNSPRVKAKVDQLMRKLSTREKIELLAGYTGPGYPNGMFTHPFKQFGIPALKMSDASVGVRVWGPSTAYPASVALAATWNPALARREGRALGEDARARGVNIVLGPGMDIVREPQGGRNFEYLGEDPDLAGQMGAAWIEGLQSERVAACAKHYAGNEQEDNRSTINSIISRRALEEIYLPPFRDAVRKGHVMTMMCAYNRVNGEYSSDNPFLLTTMLRDHWHFKGLMMSDWGATHATLSALKAGLDLEMPNNAYFNAKKIEPLLASGKLSMATIDQHVRRLLRVMVAMHFNDRPQTDRSLPKNNPHSAAVALQVEREAVVLLKNQGGMLPLAADRLHRIVLVGPDVSPAITGGAGSSYTKPNIPPVSLLEAVRTAAGPGVQVTQIPYPYPLRSIRAWWMHRPPAGIQGPMFTAQDRQLIQSADVVIAGIGPREGEGWDRHFHMPAHQDQYLKTLASINPHVIAVLYAGANVAMSAWIHQVPALLDAWYPGENGNTAVAEILFGKLNPSGKLPDSFEKHWRDAPAYGHYPGHDDHVHFAEGIFVGYRWFDSKHIAPRYPFGFGLSYTQFHIHGIAVQASGQGRRRHVVVTAEITNTGERAGGDVVQLYVRPPHTSGVVRTYQQLRGFQRVELNPGQTRTVSFHLHWRDFAYYNTGAHGWRVPAGRYGLAVGDSSRNIAGAPSVQMQ